MANKKVKVRLFEGGKAPQSKNGNWYDCYVRTASVNGVEPTGNIIRFSPGDIIVVNLGFARTWEKATRGIYYLVVVPLNILVYYLLIAWD